MTKPDAIFRKTFGFIIFVLIKYNLSLIHYHDFITRIFSVYKAHFYPKYVFYDTLIPSTLILPRPRELMHLYIITLYVNYRTDNRHNAFAHIYCLLHPSVISYIIPYFMNFSHTSSELNVHMFRCNSCIMIRVIWKCEWN